MQKTVKYLKNSIILLFLLVFAFPLPAQRLIWGTVSDAVSQEALPGVNVRLRENMSIGCVTDTNGKFILQLPDARTYTLEVSYVGYETQQRRVDAGSGKGCHFLLETRVNALSSVVVTGTRTPKLLKDAPIVTKVISEKEIRQTNAASMEELLQTEVPGMEFSYSTMGKNTTLNMQGFGGNSILFLVDGERLAGETMDNVDYNRLNLDNVKRVEIVKGASSSLYGSNAVGGVINIISREVNDPWTLNAQAHYGTHNNQRYSASLGWKNNSIRSLTSGQYQTVDAIRFKNKGDVSILYASRSYNVKERISYTSQRQKWTGRASHYFRELASGGFSHERYRDFSGGMKGEFTFSENSHGMLSYAYDQYDKSDFSLIRKTDVRDYSNVQQVFRTLFNHTWDKKNTLTLGGDFVNDYLMSYQFSDNGSCRQRTSDAFAQFDWNPTSKMNAIGALRYDYYSENKLHHVSPKVGMMYKMKHASLRASYAKGFRAPTLKELYMDFYMGGFMMIYGNPDLKPEISHNFNVAAEYTGNNCNFTLMVFYNRVGNRISMAMNHAKDGMVYMNMGSLQLVSGIDANAAASWDNGLEASVSYVYTHEAFRRGEAGLSVTRPHAATVRIAYHRKWKNFGFTCALSGRILSAVNSMEFNNASGEGALLDTVSVSYPAYTIWKLSVNQHFWNGLTLNVSIDNLFNYIPDYYYSNSPFTTGTACMVGLSADIDRLCRHFRTR